MSKLSASGRNQLVLAHPEVQQALDLLHRHARGMYAALEVLFHYRKHTSALFPPRFDPGVLLEQIDLLGDRPPKPSKRGRKKKHTREKLLTLLRQVEAVKLAHGWSGHGSDRQALEEIIQFDWRQQDVASMRTDADLSQEYEYRRGLLADARRIRAEIQAKRDF